jgi:hypothetical protein
MSTTHGERPGADHQHGGSGHEPHHHEHDHGRSTVPDGDNGHPPHDDHPHHHRGDSHTDHRHDEADHPHPHGSGAAGRRHWVRHVLAPHSHDSVDRVDAAMESSRAGIRALWISLAVLAATSIMQAVVVVLSGSVALLGDTLHNVADTLTAVPLGIAFVLAQLCSRHGIAGPSGPGRRLGCGGRACRSGLGREVCVEVAAESGQAGGSEADGPPGPPVADPSKV